MKEELTKHMETVMNNNNDDNGSNDNNSQNNDTSPKKTTLNGIDMIEDGDVTRFTVSEETKEADRRKREEEERKRAESEMGLWERIRRWFGRHEARPYVKVRDLADPTGDRARDIFDADAGSDGKSGIEAGIRITF